MSEAHQGPLYTDFIAEALGRWGDRPAFISGGSVMTYDEAAALTSQLGQLLAARGVGRGSGVGALGPNAPELWLVQAATYLLGGRFTGFNLLGSVDDHARVADEAELSVLVVAASVAGRGAEIAERSHCVRDLLTIGPAEVGEDLYDLVRRIEPEPLTRGPAEPEDIAWLQYTGGTTGVPKGVMLSQRAMAQQVQTWLASYGMPEHPRYLAAAPITHASVLAVVPTLVRGGTVVLQQSFAPDEYLACIQEHRVNYAFAVPTMLYALLDRTDLSAYDLSSLQTVMYGAAPMSPTRLTELIGILGPVFMQGYGQTETAGVGMALPRDEHDIDGHPERMTSCGRPAVGILGAILDEHHDPLPDGQVGEICIRSAAVMSGYWKQPEPTAAALAGGWLHTGDLGVRDEQGYFHIVDRLKDMVISGGFNVYPREVEDVLTSHASVSAAAVIGVPHDTWGEQVSAYVVPRAGATVDAEELLALVRARKGPHYAPKAIHVVEELPTTPVGKIDKKALRAAHWGDGVRQVN